MSSTRISVVLVVGATVLAQALAFGREVLLAHFFGAGSESDAVFAALLGYALLSAIIGGTVGTAFVPSLTSVRHDRVAFGRLVSTAATSLVILSGLTVLLIEAIPHSAIRLIAPGFESSTTGLAAGLLRLVIPAVLFHALVQLFSAVLNVQRRHAQPAFSAAINGFSVVLVMLLLHNTMGVASLCLGVLLGQVAQVGLQLLLLLKGGLALRPSLRWADPEFTSGMRMALPLAAIAVAHHVAVVINRSIASGMEVGSLSGLQYANKLTYLPYQMFFMVVTIVLYPRLSAMVKERDLSVFQTRLSELLRWTPYVIVPVSALFFFLDATVVRIAYQRGAFDSADAVLTAQALRFFAVRLIAMCHTSMLLHAFYALRDSKTPMRVTFVYMAVSAAFSLVLGNTLGYRGLALAVCLSEFSLVTMLWYMLRKRGFTDIRGPGVRAWTLLTLSGIASGAAARGVSQWMPRLLTDLEPGSIGMAILQVGAGGVTGIVVYLLATLVVGAGETASLPGVFSSLKEAIVDHFRGERGGF